MQQKVETAAEFIKQLRHLDPAINPFDWINKQNLDVGFLNEAFNEAAAHGLSECLKILYKTPGVNPAAGNNFAILRAVYHGHLEAVKFLSTLPEVSLEANDHNPLRCACKTSFHKIADYLASLPCYNPFATNISYEKKVELINLLTDLKLQDHIDTHKQKAAAEAMANLRFLFFNDPNSFFNTQLNGDVKKEIVQTSMKFENHRLTI
jgi:hypothetical protein